MEQFYWQLIQDLAHCAIEERTKVKEGLQTSSEKKISELIKDKAPEDLAKLEKEVEAMLGGASFLLDAEYWQTLLIKIKTKRCLMLFPEVLDKYVKRVEHVDEIERARAEYNNRYKPIATNVHEESFIEISDTENEYEHDDSIDEDKFATFINDHRNDVLEDCLDSNFKDMARKIGKDDKQVDAIALKLKEKVKEEYQKFMAELEEENVSAADLPERLDQRISAKLSWIDELRPRKPHFFNRVKLGYDWSRINQLHYSKDNPPPREVFGYRFNVFYPNLPDSSFVPKYEIKIAENPEHCFITFKAGPPYEDISFKILNKQWNMADRKTFKCIFDRGILHLYFDFEKAFYRR